MGINVPERSHALTYIQLAVYRDLFSARDDAYVYDSSQHIKAYLTPDLLFDALTTGHSISGYTATFDEGVMVTNVGAIDLDEGSLDDAAGVRGVLKQHDIPSLVVGSRRGFHLWTFHGGSGAHGTTKGSLVPADTVREALRASCVLSGLPAHNPKPNKMNTQWCRECDEPVHRHVEVFPKNSVKSWGVGALRMPLMPHPKTKVVYPAYAMDGREIKRVGDLVDTVADMTAPFDRVWELAGGAKTTVPYPNDLGSYRRETTHDAPTVTSLLTTFGLTAEPGHSVRCPFHEDGKASLSIARDDERCFCKSPTCDLYNDGRGMGSLQLRAYMEASHG